MRALSRLALAVLLSLSLFSVAGCLIDRGAIAAAPGDEDAAWGDAGPRPDAYVEDSGPLDRDAGAHDGGLGVDASTHDAAHDAAIVEPLCVEGRSMCTIGEGGEPAVRRCVGGTWELTRCSLPGCGTSAANPEDHCLEIEPSNIPLGALEGLGSRGPLGAGTLDAGTCAGPGMALGGGYCIVRVDDVTIPTAQTLTITSPSPLVIVADRDVSIAGRIIVAPAADDPSVVGAGGAGSVATGTLTDDGGGAGGSFCGRGGPGGDGVSGPSSGGVPSAIAPMSRLRMGAPGGRGSNTHHGGGGGVGGGALQITSLRGTITVSGGIHAVGGGGGGGTTLDADPDENGSISGAGGGGGSGGGVWLEAWSMTLAGNAVDVRGGGGGAGACYRAKNGMAHASAGGPGQMGDPSGTARPGGAASPICPGFSGPGGETHATGGPGGAGAGVTRIGGLADEDGVGGGVGDNGGGGGGGAGCVVLRASEGGIVAIEGGSFVPRSTASRGRAAVR